MQTIRIALAARSRAGFPQGVSISTSRFRRATPLIYIRRETTPKPRRNVITGGDPFRFHESTGLSKISLSKRKHRPKKLRGASACPLLRHPEYYCTSLGGSRTFSEIQSTSYEPPLPISPTMTPDPNPNRHRTPFRNQDANPQTTTDNVPITKRNRNRRPTFAPPRAVPSIRFAAGAQLLDHQPISNGLRNDFATPARHVRHRRHRPPGPNSSPIPHRIPRRNHREIP